jgi:hypothetical protein
MPLQRAHEDVVDRGRKMANNAINKSMLQAASGPVVFAQFDGDEYQDALNKDMLPGGPGVPNGLVGIALAPRIVGLAIAARLDGPEIDPCHNGWIIFPTREGAKSWKVVEVIDDERVGRFSGHG